MDAHGGHARETGRTRVTIASIADETGVSVPTVSKVLNGRPDVSPRTRARVEEALERSHYQRRRGTRPSATPLIDLVFPELDWAWSIEIIRGAEAAAAAAGAGIVLSSLAGEHRPPQTWLDAVLSRRPLGVIFVLSSLDAAQQHQLSSRSIPFVVVDTEGEPPAGVPTVGSNNWNGGLQATRHLLDLGHRRVAMISGDESLLCSRARLDGYRSAHDTAGIPVDAALVRTGNFTVEDGYRHGLDLLSRTDRPTAIFAGSDMQALGVLRAARDLDLHVPRDLSVVGYDDLPMAEWTQPPLTTVAQPLHAMARTATEILVAIAREESPSNQRVDLATELVVRQSCAPPTTI